MTDDSAPRPEVSFSDVAAEAPDESVAHETESLDDGVPAGGEESTNDTPPEQPTLSSLTSGGPGG